MITKLANPVAYGYTLEYVNTTTWDAVVENYGADSPKEEIEARKAELRKDGYVPFSEISGGN